MNEHSKMMKAPTHLALDQEVARLKALVYDPHGLGAAMLRFERAVRCFNRAMRRHEKRAAAQGLVGCAGTMAVIRGSAEHATTNERLLRRCIVYGEKRDILYGTRQEPRQINFFYALAADACAKLAEPRRLLTEAEARVAEDTDKGWKLESFKFGSIGTVSP